MDTTRIISNISGVNSQSEIGNKVINTLINNTDKSVLIFFGGSATTEDI